MRSFNACSPGDLEIQAPCLLTGVCNIKLRQYTSKNSSTELEKTVFLA